MSDVKVYDVPAEVAERAHLTDDQYQEMYQRSVSDPDGFWAEQAEEFVDWFQKWDKVRDYDFSADNLHVKWFTGAKLNVSYNCLDRHLETRGDQAAIIWEGDDPSVDKTITYRELHKEVCKFANGLKARGVEKGDRVSIYMPMIPEAAVALLACARRGAGHAGACGGCASRELATRVEDGEGKGGGIGPVCPFIRAFGDENPEYETLIDHELWDRIDARLHSDD